MKNSAPRAVCAADRRLRSARLLVGVVCGLTLWGCVPPVTPPPGPTITSISTNSGPGAGGTFVTITGTGFTDATAITFGTTPATVFIIQNDVFINVESPPGTAGTVDIRV